MSATCDPLVQGASDGVAAALSAVDCMAGEATASAFARLFGTHGALLPALTLLLTLYIAIFALGLLTGRARLGVATLTPRMLLIGVVLTFATSWVAYQGVLWNLMVGAPDQVAGVLMGAKGQATHLFAARIDVLFQAIADAADMANRQQAGAGTAAAPAAAGTFAPASLVWLAAVLLLLGTVGGSPVYAYIGLRWSKDTGVWAYALLSPLPGHNGSRTGIGWNTIDQNGNVIGISYFASLDANGNEVHTDVHAVLWYNSSPVNPIDYMTF